MRQRVPRVLISGGGTGGHVYPALAVATALRDRLRAEVLYVGTRRGLEARLVPAAGIPFRTVSARGLVGKSPAQAMAAVLAAARGALESWRLVRQFRPDLMVATGGYVCGPTALVARLMGVPLVLQEQNVLPGFTVRLLSRWAELVCVPSAETEKYLPGTSRVAVTGNPIRPEITATAGEEARRRLGLEAGMPWVLVFSGSRGARTVVEATVQAVPHWMAKLRAGLFLVTGTRYYRWAQQRLRQLGIPPEGRGHIMVRPYLEEMHLALAAADLVVARAGAMTVAEITARGLPAILVPSPHVAANHQEYNARWMERHGAAVVIPDHEFTGEALLATAQELLSDRQRLADMARASRGLGRPEALDRMVQLIAGLLGVSEGRDKRG